MRIIAFGHKELSDVSDIESEEYHREMESDMVFDGFVAISDPLRADVYEAVKKPPRRGSCPQNSDGRQYLYCKGNRR